MTREEAIAAFNGVSNPNSFASPVWIERFVALGMLKLDEPRTAEMRAGAIIAAYVSGTDTAAILMELARAGLKIVDGPVQPFPQETDNG